MEVFDATSGAIPITILTGFLGAGKTTLLNRILASEHGLKVGVLVNDFGSLNVDAELVVGVESDMISFANGCVCCEIRDDLRESVIELTTNRKDIQYILLEASGVADPAGIYLTFNDGALRDRIRLDSVTCVVDTDQVLEQLDQPMVQNLLLRQIGCADMTILNKASLAGDQKLNEVKKWLSQSFNNLRIAATDYCLVPFEILLGVGGDRSNGLLNTDVISSREVFSSWTYTEREQLSLDALKKVIEELPGSIYRTKGTVHSSDYPESRVLVQSVGRRVDFSIMGPWEERKRANEIIVIGARDAISNARLTELFNSSQPGHQSTSNHLEYELI